MADTTNSRTFILRDALALYATLPALEGHEGDSVTTTPDQRPKLIPYVFGAEGKGGGKVRYNIAKNMTILKREQDAFIAARDGLISEISDGTGTIQPDDTEKVAKLNKATADLLDSNVEIRGLLNIPVADLNLDANPHLSASVLAALSAIISE